MKTNGRIIYFPMKYFPSYELTEHFKRLQAEINHTNAMIHVEEKFDLYKVMLRKQQLANRLRQTIHIVKK